MLDEVREVLEGRRRWAVVEADSLLALRDLPGECLPHWADLTRRRLAAEEAGVSLADVDAGQGALFGGGA